MVAKQVAYFGPKLRPEAEATRLLIKRYVYSLFYLARANALASVLALPEEISFIGKWINFS